MPTVEGLRFSYVLHELPPGRFGFRRWRWELWHGARLAAAGWRASPGAAERALGGRAAVLGHELFGLRPPPVPVVAAPFRPGATVRLEAGGVSCELVPRALAEG